MNLQISLKSSARAQIQGMFHTLGPLSTYPNFKNSPKCETFVESDHLGTSPDPLTKRKRETFIEFGPIDARAELFNEICQS